MTKYKYSRENCWDLLTNAVRVRILSGDYVIDPDTFHKVREMLQTKVPIRRYENGLVCPDCITEHCRHCKCSMCSVQSKKVKKIELPKVALDMDKFSMDGPVVNIRLNKDLALWVEKVTSTLNDLLKNK